MWKCKCDCGNIGNVSADVLRHGRSNSCGCYRKEFRKTHGESTTRLFYTWKAMMARCYNIKSQSYYNYGTRGIKVCNEWHDFLKFKEWAYLTGYNDELEIDRIDNYKNYEPSNCRWATEIEQANNKRNNINITWNNATHTLSEWARILNIKRKVLNNRLYEDHWSVDRAFTTVPRTYKKHGIENA